MLVIICILIQNKHFYRTPFWYLAHKTGTDTCKLIIHPQSGSDILIILQLKFTQNVKESSTMEIKTSFVGYIYTSNWSAIFTFKIRKSITYFSCYWPFEKSPFFSSTNFFNNPVRITFNHSYFPHIFYSISQTRNPEWGKPIISHLRIVFEFFSFFFFGMSYNYQSE